MAKWPRFDPDADRRLAKALSEGGEESLAALYDIYAERLRDYCGSLIRDPRVATDIVHDTLIDASRRVRRMRDRVRLRAWLYAAIRRRCLQRVRHPALRWTWSAEPAGQEAKDLLETAFDRLDFLDQEALLLALRHDLNGEDLGALLGIPARRAGARIARAQTRADDAIRTAQTTLARRCAGGQRAGDKRADRKTGAPRIKVNGTAPPEVEPDVADSREPGGAPGSWVANADAAERGSAERGAAEAGAAERDAERSPLVHVLPPTGDAALADHVASCDDCLRRGELSVPALLGMMPAPPLPTALRLRVIHTGTDPELAGYRADIAARGGTLNADGLPRQPDIPSHFARRWLFTGAGMAGALITAIIAALLIGPGAPIPGLIWPSLRPEPTIKPEPPSHRAPSGQQPQPPANGPTLPGGAAPQVGPSKIAKSPGPTASTGTLAVSPGTIDFGSKNDAAKLTLSVTGRPLSWRAVPSNSRITLSADHGDIQAGADAVLTVTFNRAALLELPGNATITVTDSDGKDHVVAVIWNGSLL
jgi:DNA-directed RNA polymerase specialized sigma24 family protein